MGTPIKGKNHEWPGEIDHPDVPPHDPQRWPFALQPPDHPQEIVLRLYACKSDLSMDAAAEIVRLRQALRWQDDRDGRIGTHSDNCYTYGKNHYECALQKIRQLSINVENWGDHD